MLHRYIPWNSGLPWWNDPLLTDKNEILHGDKKIFGEYQIPINYTLVQVPRNAPVSADPTCHGGRTRKGGIYDFQEELCLSSTYNIPKLIISLVQAIWATVTIYRARGDQIEEYGYAAFGLTVIPYAFMSIMNIIANLLTPHYPAAYLLRTPLMDEAEEHDGKFPYVIRANLGLDD
jgi:hypothetical protein